MRSSLFHFVLLAPLAQQVLSMPHPAQDALDLARKTMIHRRDDSQVSNPADQSLYSSGDGPNGMPDPSDPSSLVPGAPMSPADNFDGPDDHIDGDDSSSESDPDADAGPTPPNPPAPDQPGDDSQNPAPTTSADPSNAPASATATATNPSAATPSPSPSQTSDADDADSSAIPWDAPPGQLSAPVPVPPADGTFTMTSL